MHASCKLGLRLPPRGRWSVATGLDRHPAPTRPGPQALRLPRAGTPPGKSAPWAWKRGPSWPGPPSTGWLPRGDAFTGFQLTLWRDLQKQQPRGRFRRTASGAFALLWLRPPFYCWFSECWPWGPHQHRPESSVTTNAHGLEPGFPGAWVEDGGWGWGWGMKGWGWGMEGWGMEGCRCGWRDGVGDWGGDGGMGDEGMGWGIGVELGWRDGVGMGTEGDARQAGCWNGDTGSAKVTEESACRPRTVATVSVALRRPRPRPSSGPLGLKQARGVWRTLTVSLRSSRQAWRVLF